MEAALVLMGGPSCCPLFLSHLSGAGTHCTALSPVAQQEAAEDGFPKVMS